MAPQVTEGASLMNNVLVAEDDQHLAHLLEKGLRRYDLIPTVATTAEATVAAAISGRFAVLILDLDGSVNRTTAGPDGTGNVSGSLAVLHRLRAAHCAISVIVLDGRAGPRDAASARAAGAAAYLSVPFRFADLVPLVERFLPH
jgi:two-component system copper resistance phosphate regulon response regulator CusR